MNMKKTLALLLVVTMGLGYAAQAQAGFKIGPRIGLNVNKLNPDGKLLDGSNNCGFTLGVQAEYMTPLSLGVDLSLMYTYMDYKLEGDISGHEYKPNLAKNFIEIPLNIKYKIGIPVVKKIFSPYIFTGPSVALKLGKDKGYDIEPINANAKANTKTAQWVWNVGVGLEFINHLQIGASYGFGMNNIVKDFEVKGVNLQAGEVKAKTGYWTVTAAWLF